MQECRCYVHHVRHEGGTKRASPNRKRTQNSPLLRIVQKVDNAFPADCRLAHHAGQVGVGQERVTKP